MPQAGPNEALVGPSGGRQRPRNEALDNLTEVPIKYVDKAGLPKADISTRAGPSEATMPPH